MSVGLRVSICTKGLAYLIAVQIVEQISFGCRLLLSMDTLQGFCEHCSSAIMSVPA